jgi:hypothetical protein
VDKHSKAGIGEPEGSLVSVLLGQTYQIGCSQEQGCKKDFLCE